MCAVEAAWGGAPLPAPDSASGVEGRLTPETPFSALISPALSDSTDSGLELLSLSLCSSSTASASVPTSSVEPAVPLSDARMWLVVGAPAAWMRSSCRSAEALSEGDLRRTETAPSRKHSGGGWWWPGIVQSALTFSALLLLFRAPPQLS